MKAETLAWLTVEFGRSVSSVDELTFDDAHVALDHLEEQLTETPAGAWNW